VADPAVELTGRHAVLREMRRPVRRVDELATRETTRYLPTHPRIADLLPWDGLRRGAVIGVHGSASLLLAVIGAAMQDGAWAGVVGIPELGMVAAAEHGVDLTRFGLVPHPGPDWPRAVGALIDSIDLVAVATPVAPSTDQARGLAARARQHGTVLIAARPGWPGADLTLEVVGRTWSGLGWGHGRLKLQELQIVAAGRGAATRRKAARLPMPLPAVDAPLEQSSVPLNNRESWTASA
jgi:hypothetical protein